MELNFRFFFVKFVCMIKILNIIFLFYYSYNKIKYATIEKSFGHPNK